MEEASLCGKCGVPLLIGRELRWGSNGVITLAASTQSRMILYESNVIDNLFRGIEELIGLPIQHLVIESRRREVRRYVEKRFPAPLRRILSAAGDGLARNRAWTKPVRKPLLKAGKRVATRVAGIGKFYGYGDSRLGELWESGETHPWRTNVIRNPYSLPFWSAEALGAAEAFDGVDQWVRCEQMDASTYRVTTYVGDHPVDLKERLQRRRYPFKPADIAFEPCPECGLPREVGRYRWNLEEGTIYDTDYGWRMAIYGPSALEAVLDDLEAELGESVPEVVAEAQRRYVRSRIGGHDWMRGGLTFNRLTALRGLGNITRFEADESRLDLNIQNSCLAPMMVGMAQAIFETALNKDSTTRAWSLAEDGDLEISIQG